MPLSQKHVDKLKSIWFRKTGELVSNEEAWKMATRVFTYFDVLLSIDPALPVDNSDLQDSNRSEKLISTEPKE